MPLGTGTHAVEERQLQLAPRTVASPAQLLRAQLLRAQLLRAQLLRAQLLRAQLLRAQLLVDRPRAPAPGVPCEAIARWVQLAGVPWESQEIFKATMACR
eukprot:4139725-Prymnesium_polylepis.1